MKTFKILLIATVAVLVGACSGSVPTPAEVAAKIDSNEVLDQSDYAAMIEYCGDYAKKAQNYFDLIEEQPSDSTAEYARAATDLADLKANNPYIDMFREAIYSASESQLGEKNVAKVKEYEKYEAFPLPEGAGPSLQQPGVDGYIEQMPDSDTTGVISQGAGEAVE